MTQRPRFLALLLILALSSSVALAKKRHSRGYPSSVMMTEAARFAAIQRAQIWSAQDIGHLNLKTGPAAHNGFALNSLVTCDFTPKSWPGTSLKFDCALRRHDVVKVRYGDVNGKVEGEVLGSRLLWALGFGADRVYPVRVRCRGCPADPWNDRRVVPGGLAFFEPAAIERKFLGTELKTERHVGWGWPELGLVSEANGGAPKAQREALLLLAVFMQLTDTKSDQQRLVCLPGGLTDAGTCTKPFMLVHDVGLSFGASNYFNRTTVGSVNFTAWSHAPVWRDAAACVGNVGQSITGTLEDGPRISEAGRQFLAAELAQLTDRQLHDLFEVGQVDRRSRNPNSDEPPAPVGAWVVAFKAKRAEIVDAHCPS